MFDWCSWCLRQNSGCLMTCTEHPSWLKKQTFHRPLVVDLQQYMPDGKKIARTPENTYFVDVSIHLHDAPLNYKGLEHIVVIFEHKNECFSSNHCLVMGRMLPLLFTVLQQPVSTGIIVVSVAVILFFKAPLKIIFKDIIRQNNDSFFSFFFLIQFLGYID